MNKGQKVYENRPGLRNLAHYKSYISRLPAADSIEIGYLFSYFYKFSLDYEFEKLRYFDWMPVGLCFKIKSDTGNYFCLNFHHLPVRARQVWLARAKRLWKKKFPTKGKNVGKPLHLDLNYARIIGLLYKAKLGVRQYRFDRTLNLRYVPNNEWDNIFKYHANTYFKTTYAKKVQLYLEGRTH